MAEKIKEATVFNQEDIDRKVILAAGDMAPEFSLENSDGVSIGLRD